MDILPTPFSHERIKHDELSNTELVISLEFAFVGVIDSCIVCKI